MSAGLWTFHSNYGGSMFTTPLRAEFSKNGYEVMLTSPLVWDDGTVEVVCPTGMVSDLATIHRPLTGIMPKIGKHTYGAVLHDGLYRGEAKVTILDPRTYSIYGTNEARQIADRLFLEAMKSLDTGWYQRWPMYWAVRLGGWVPWNRYRR